MWRVARAAAFEEGSLTLTVIVRRDLESIEMCECGCSVKSRDVERNVLLNHSFFDAHRDFEKDGVRVVDIIAIDPDWITDETTHLEAA